MFGETNLYAIIKCSGKQFKVKEGDIIDVDNLNLKENDELNFNIDNLILINDDKNLFFNDEIKKKAYVKSVVIKNFKDKKIIVYKFKAKKGYHKKRGHRQMLTSLMIKQISLG
jgi:large subunit ribosomal protein L21